MKRNHPSPTPPQPPAAPAQRCANCDDTCDVTSTTGEWRGVCHCAAGDAIRARSAKPARQAVALTDADIDKVTISQWGSNQLGAMLQAHRACARAVERASWAANGITAGDTGGGNG